MGWDGHKKRTRANDGIAKQPDRGTERDGRTPFLGGHTQTASKKIDLVEESEVKSGERSVAFNKCLQSRIRARLNDSVVAFLFLRFASCEGDHKMQLMRFVIFFTSVLAA